MSRRSATLGVSAFLAIGLGLGGSVMKVPYVSLGPGPVTNTLGSVGGEPLIEIEGHASYPASGHLDLTTVSVFDDLTLSEALNHWFSRRHAVVPRESVYPPGRSDEEVEQEVRAEMAESQSSATTAALRYLKIPVVTNVVLDAVTPGSPAAVVLRAGDVVVAVDGQKVASLTGVRNAITKRNIGDPVRIGYRRAGVVKTATLTTVAPSEGQPRPTIGVVLREQSKYPFTVKIRLEEVGGPSAGTMFALGIIDRLTPGDLTAGKHVAGTGTIDDDGNVGPIGGIQQKLIAARDAGAGWFLTPADNYSEASRAKPDGLELISIATLTEAVAAVQRIAAAG